MSRDCPFLYWDKNIAFMGGYACRKTRERILTGTALYENYCHNYEDGYKQCPHFVPEQTSSGGCYLTSACTEAKGLPDNCAELTALRGFRDEWLAVQPGGQAVIEDYYRTAPKIVTAIHASPDCEAVLDELYRTLVFLCVELIRSGKPETAYEEYREKTVELKEKLKYSPEKILEIVRNEAPHARMNVYNETGDGSIIYKFIFESQRN